MSAGVKMENLAGHSAGKVTRHWVGRLFGLLAGMISLLTGCQWERATEPSVLVLAVESLPFEGVNCVDADASNSQEDGFQILCRESVRFSHTFTPSPLSQPALVSLLTGLWPYEHKVRDNGATPLAAKYLTTAEVAYSRGYRTAFFSGGAPIFRKSGISQGFELFEDNIQLRPEKIFRSLSESVRLFRQWYQADVSGRKFFAVIYIPDLQIFDEPTLDEKGRIIERSYGGRIRRLQSSLAELFEFLKEENQWNSTYIFLTGLNGYSDQERFNEIPSTNLHVENTQVSLVIKPPQKSRDLGLSWKIDANTSLLDVAKTVYEILGHDPNPDSGHSLFPVFSLMGSLQKAEAVWPNDRIIPIESNWAEWKGMGSIRIGFRAKEQLLLFDEKFKLFNTLTDRLELNPAHVSSEWDEKLKKASELIEIRPWAEIPQQILHQVDVAINLWDPSGRSGLIQIENERDPVIAGWLAIRAIENRDWRLLSRLAKLHNNRFWSALAETFMTNKSVYPKSACIDWARQSSLASAESKKCGDSMFKNLVGWVKGDQENSDTVSYRENFVRNYRNLMLDRRIAQLSFVNGLNWDVSSIYTQGPVLSELYLNYPENRKYWNQLQDRLKSNSADGGFF